MNNNYNTNSPVNGKLKRRTIQKMIKFFEQLDEKKFDMYTYKGANTGNAVTCNSPVCVAGWTVLKAPTVAALKKVEYRQHLVEDYVYVDLYVNGRQVEVSNYAQKLLGFTVSEANYMFTTANWAGTSSFERVRPYHVVNKLKRILKTGRVIEPAWDAIQIQAKHEYDDIDKGDNND